MKTLYEKSESGFAMLWIGAYAVLGSGAELVGAAIGAGNEIRTALYGLMTLALLFFLRQNGLMQRFGFRRPAVPARRFFWFVPLAIVSAGNLVLGVAMPGTAWLTALLVIRMLLVGILEELLFRGLLYRALERYSETAAIVVSSVAFGLIHLLNLFGASLLPVAFQTVFATALGFLFALILARGGSIIPCIAAHCLIDVTSVFTDANALTPTRFMIVSGAMIGLVVLYTLILLRTLPKNEKTPEQPAE